MTKKDLELALRITAKDNTGNALGKTRAGVESISDQLAVAKTQLVAFAASLVGLGQLRALVALTDELQSVNARLKQATGNLKSFAAAQTLAYRVAAETGAGYKAVAALYSRLSLTAKDYGLAQDRIGAVTVATAKALQLSGASAAESAAVILQLSQALGSGVLRGEEFNAIMENGGRLAKALADGLGVPIGQLRALAEQGVLSTELVARALESQRATLEAEAAAMPRTIGQAVSGVGDEFGRLVDAMNQASGATATIAGAFDALGRHLSVVLGAGAVAAAGALTVAINRLVAALAQAIAAKLSAVAAEQRLTAATVASTAAVAARGAALRGLAATLGFLGGPIGAITTLLTVGATAWLIWGDRAASAADRAKNRLQEVDALLDRVKRKQKHGEGDAGLLNEEAEALESRISALAQTRGSAGAEAELKKARARLAEILAAQDALAADQPGAPNALNRELMRRQWDEYIKQYRGKGEELAAALAELRQKAQAAGISVAGDEFKKAEAALRAKFRGQGKPSALPALRQDLDESFRLVKDALDRESRALDQALEDRRIGIADWYAEKDRVAEDGFASERARLERERAVVKTKGEVAKINADLIILERERASVIGKLASAAAQKEKDYRDAIEETRVALLRAQGKGLAAQLAEIEAAYRNAQQKFAADPNALSLVEQLFDAQTAKAELQLARSNVGKKTKTRPKARRRYAIGGADGTRTRDPRRDRPVF